VDAQIEAAAVAVIAVALGLDLLRPELIQFPNRPPSINKF
jgi:hypothetical protein